MNPCTNDWVKLRGKINYGDIYEKTQHIFEIQNVGKEISERSTPFQVTLTDLTSCNSELEITVIIH